jgi:hypothetical protein
MLSLSLAFNIRTKILSKSQDINLFGERLGGRVRDFRSVIFWVITHPPAADYTHAYTSKFRLIQLVNFILYKTDTQMFVKKMQRPTTYFW